MFDFLEQLELFAACFLQLRRTPVDLILRTPLSKITSTGEIEQQFRLN